MTDALGIEFVSGMLVGFGVAGITVAIIFWIDKIIEFHWRRGRK